MYNLHCGFVYRYGYSLGPVRLVGWYISNGRNRPCTTFISTENWWNILPSEWNVSTSIPPRLAVVTGNKSEKCILINLVMCIMYWASLCYTGTKLGGYWESVCRVLAEKNRHTLLLEVHRRGDIIYIYGGGGGKEKIYVLWHFTSCRCGYFCYFPQSRKQLVQIDTLDSEVEEREQLQEPLDQISLSSVDSLEPDNCTRIHGTKDSTLWYILIFLLITDHYYYY